MEQLWVVEEQAFEEVLCVYADWPSVFESNTCVDKHIDCVAGISYPQFRCDFGYVQLGY